MNRGQTGPGAAVGFAVKSGWAAAVALAGSPTSPTVADSRRVDLCDPTLPESRQPYHAGFSTARESGPELDRLLESVQRFGMKSVGNLLEQRAADGLRLVGVGLVAGSLVDPDTIGNSHIRIHAMEGRLFRSVIERAAAENNLSCATWRERDLDIAATEVIGRGGQSVRTAVASFKDSVKGPWRAEQKAATIAAWLVLAKAGGLPQRSR